MSDEPRDKQDDRVVSERAQAPSPATPVVGGSLTDADTISQPGQVGAPDDDSDDESIRQTTYKLPGSREQVPATAATGAELRSVEATTALLERSGAEQVTAERVTLDRSGAKSIDAKSAQLDRSGVVALGSEQAVLLNSSAVQVVAEEARLSKSKALFVQADRVTLEGSRVVVLAGAAEGDVQTVFTRETAAVFGAALGFVFALLTIVLTRGRRARG
jgi:hypothetical protein